MNIKIHQLYYSEETKAMCHPDTVHIDCNIIRQPYFENYYIAFYPVVSCDYVAFLSARFTQKTGITIERLLQQIDGEHDLYYYHWPHRFPNVWYQGEHAHSGLMVRAAAQMPDKLDIILKPTLNIYCNYFVIKYDKFIEYRHLLHLQLGSMHTNMKDPCKYAGAKLNRVQLLHQTGLPYYSFAPFFLERLPGTFLKDLKAKKLTK